LGGDAAGPDAPAEDVRWEETDPWGQRIACAGSVWREHLARRGELSAHEAAVRETVRDPDRLYLDVASTLWRRARVRPDVEIVHYVAAGRTTGGQAGNLVVVVVKWLGRSPTTPARGYLTTAWFSDRLKPGLHLVWSRPA
jgi:hypothetical protein